MTDRLTHLSRPLTKTDLDSVRHVEGFPKGTDEDIVALSCPPYYTICPNPFIGEFVRAYGKPYSESTDTDQRLPFSTDVSEGKNDPLYKVHAYHTKVPPRAIVRYLLHYTRPNDLVLDVFCGSGMTGLAAQLCAAAPADWAEGEAGVEWGARRAILCDLSPYATAIAANYNLPLNANEFQQHAERLIQDCRDKTSSLYNPQRVRAPRTRFQYAVWSQVFGCPNCSGDINFLEVAYVAAQHTVLDTFTCPNCRRQLTKRDLQKRYEMILDPISRTPHSQILYRLGLVALGFGKRPKLREASVDDIELAKQTTGPLLPDDAPHFRLPIETMYHGSRLGPKGVDHIHHLYFGRQLVVLADMWKWIRQVPDPRMQSALRFLIDQVIVPASKLARYPQRGPLGGVYYMPSLVTENEPTALAGDRLATVGRFFKTGVLEPGRVIVSTNSASNLAGIPDDSIDYIFTDPPFGENIPYADLNLMLEAWYGVFTAVEFEAIIDRAKNKGLDKYQRMMSLAFQECHRVLKPGRWMTVVFHNSSNAVWNAIQEAILSAGFVVCDVRTLDSEQGSYRQVTSMATKQGLVISAYKPPLWVELSLRQANRSRDTPWEFIRQHLDRLPVYQESNGVAEIIRERMDSVLYDRMVATHVQRQLPVPMRLTVFVSGLRQRFPERDGMYFRPEQVAEYDEKRSQVLQMEELSLVVSDEKSAVQWLRLDLERERQTYQEIQPRFLQELHQARHEMLVELGQLLSENFVKDKAERWYVPDPSRAEDLEKVRERGLMREFANYQLSKGKLKTFRTEAVRAGFKAAWSESDYGTIIAVASRLPEDVLQEDAALLMYYDNALTRRGA